MLKIEPQFVQVVIQMARIGDPLTPIKALELINDMIASTEYQVQVKKWKQTHTITSNEFELGQVDYKYWLNFKKRNSDKIITRKGEKFELDRSNWTTYHNFDQMYNCFSNEMVYANVAELLPEPVWMNKEGDVIKEEESFGCKVTHKISHPDMILCMD